MVTILVVMELGAYVKQPFAETEYLLHELGHLISFGDVPPKKIITSLASYVSHNTDELQSSFLKDMSELLACAIVIKANEMLKLGFGQSRLLRVVNTSSDMSQTFAESMIQNFLKKPSYLANHVSEIKYWLEI